MNNTYLPIIDFVKRVDFQKINGLYFLNFKNIDKIEMKKIGL